MGGRGSGGRRVGSGRKGKRATVVRHPSSADPASIDTFDPPAELQGNAAELANLLSQLAFLQHAERPDRAPNPQIEALETRIEELQARARALAIWHELAPSAFAKRTLTPETSAAFVMLCRAVVQERALSASSAVGGPNHRGLMHRVATWMKDFCLSPFGKPLSEAKPAAAVVSKWSGLLR